MSSHLKQSTLSNGAQLIPLDLEAQEQLKLPENVITQHVNLDHNSILMFAGKLPENLTLKNNSTVRLEQNATLKDCVVDNSRIFLNQTKGSNSVFANSSIDDQLDPDETVPLSRTDTIENFYFKNCDLTGKLHFFNINSNHHGICTNMQGENVCVDQSLIDGGSYENVNFRNSLIQQPGTSYFKNCNFADTSVTNHEQFDKDFEKGHGPEHVFNDAVLISSTIITDQHHQTYLDKVKARHMMAINGLYAENSDIIGPNKRATKIFMDNLMFNHEDIDFHDADQSIKVAGLRWYNRHPHTNDVYYTKLLENHQFNTQNMNHAHNFSPMETSYSLIRQGAKMLYGYGQANEADDFNKIDQELAFITKESKALDTSITDTLNSRLHKVNEFELE